MDWDEIDRELAALGDVPLADVERLLERYGDPDRSLSHVDAALSELSNGARIDFEARLRDRPSFRTLQGLPQEQLPAIPEDSPEPESSAPEPRLSALPLGWVAESEEAGAEPALDSSDEGSGPLEGFELDARGEITVTTAMPSPDPEPPKQDGYAAWLVESEPPPALTESERPTSEHPAGEPLRAFAPPVDEHARSPMARMEDDFSPPTRRSSVPVHTPSERPPSLRPEVAALLDQALDPSEFPPPRSSRPSQAPPAEEAIEQVEADGEGDELEMLVDDEDIIELDDEELIDDDEA